MKRIIILLLMMSCAQQMMAQSANYQLVLKNDSLLSSTIYEFDISIILLGDTPFELAEVQAIMNFNVGISGGSLSFTIVNGSSALVTAQSPTNANLSMSGNELRVLPNTPPGSGNGTIITTLKNGTRLGRFRITSSTPFTNQSANITWKNVNDPYTQLWEYIGGIYTEVTDSTGHVVTLTNASLSPLLLTTSSPLPSGTSGISYTDTLKATGGTAPYSWAVISGSLPTGLTLSADGIISGTTTIAGTFPFTAQVNDVASDTITKALTLTISPAPASQLLFIQQPTATSAGATISPAVTVQVTDAFGNPVSSSGVSVKIALANGSGTLNGTKTVTTNASGIATFSTLSLNIAGIKQLQATATLLDTATSNSFNISAASANKLSFSQPPTTATAGSPITPPVTVQVLDVFGNAVSSAGISITMSLFSGSGTLLGTLTQLTDASGLATFSDLNIDLTGSKRIRATSSGLTQVTSSSFTITSGPANKLVFIQQPTNDIAGAVITPPITVQLQDTFGNTNSTSGIPISIAVFSGTGSLGGTTPRNTNSSGLASFNDISINQTGAKTLTATSTGLVSAVSNSFTLAADTIIASAGPNGTISPSGTITMISGSNQTFTIAPNTGYHVLDVVVDGTSVGAQTSFAFTNITTNHTIAASFAIDSLTITASAGANGSISPSGVVKVAYNLSRSFTITPNTGYHIADVVVDGSSVGVQTGYTFTNVIANHTISASFAIDTFTITSSTGVNGTIAPLGSVNVNYGSSQTFTFTPNTGYHVDSLIVDGVKQPSASSYTFNTVTGNHTIRATFAIDQFTITSSTGANGSISPLGTVNLSYGANQSFTMTPTTGYHIDSIFVDGAFVGSSSPYQFTNITANHTINVKFAINTFTITSSAGANGSITPLGAVIVTYGASRAFTITPTTGYHVDSVFVDGVSQGAVSSFTFTNVTANHTISASFAINTYTITASAGANGAISPSGSVGVSFGSSQLFTFTPNTGYHISNVIVDGSSVGAVPSYAFNGITTNHTITASFAIDTLVITASAGANGSISPPGTVNVTYGSSQSFTITPSTGYHVLDVTVDGVSVGAVTSRTFTNVTTNHTIAATFDINVYTITASTGVNGSILPSGSVNVNYGSSQTFTFTPNTGYHVDSLIVDGVKQPSASSYTFNTVTGNHTIRATFAIDQFTITSSTGANGSISPLGTVNLSYGANQSFTMTPTTGYHIDSIFVDGAFVGSSSPYQFTNITANHTINVKFAINTFTITSSAGANGSITPLGAVIVTYGASRAFTITPTTGYHVDSVFVDGVSQGAVSSFTFTNVTANHTISASFAINTYTITASAGANGAISPSGSVGVSFGSSQLFTFTPNTGYHVANALVDGVSKGTSTSYTFTAISASHTISVSFAPDTLSITVTTVPAGLAITVDGITFTSPHTFSWVAATNHTIVSDTIQNGTSGTRYAWNSWSDAGARSHSVSSLVTTTYTANFTTQYFLTMSANTGGTVSPASNWFNAGQVVTIIAFPSAFYDFVQWAGTGNGSTNSTNDTATVTMNASITETGNFTRSPIQIVIQANSPGRAFLYDGVTYTTPQTRTVAPGVEHFLDAPAQQSGGVNTQYVWTSWSDGGARFHSIFPDSAATYTVNFTKQYFLTLVATPAIGGSVGPVNGYQDSGSVVSISALANTGYSFSSWKGTGTGSFTGVSNPANVTINAPIIDTARFSLDTLTITATAGANGTISPSGAVKVPYGGSQAFTIAATGVYHISDVVVDGSSVGAVPSYSFTNVTIPHTITASFTVNGYTITASAGPNGSITPNGPVSVNGGTNQLFTLTPSTGYHVDSLIVDAVSQSPATSYTFTNIQANHTIRAVFAPNILTITVQTNPTGRTIIIDDTVYTSPKTFTWTAGTSHKLSSDTLQNGAVNTRYRWNTWSDTGTITHTVVPLVNKTYTATFVKQYLLSMIASPVAGGTVLPLTDYQDSGKIVAISASPSILSGYSFSSWKGSGSGSYTGPSNPSTVTMNGVIADTALFTLIPVHVTIKTNPVGRSYTVDGTTYTTTQIFTFPYGTTHSIGTTTPQSGTTGIQYAWLNWSDGGTISHPITPLVDTSITANFGTQYLLTMATGTGGNVSPVNTFYNAGQVASISATPDPGYQFAGWSGSGSGSYTGPVKDTSVTMNAPITQTASFTRFGAQVTVQTNPAGLKMIVDGTQYTSPQTFTWTTGSSHIIAAVDTQGNLTTTRYLWNSWNDGGLKSHAVTPLRDTTFTAGFITQYYLTMNANIGGTANPVSNWFNRTQVVTIIAVPSATYDFFGWAGTGSGSTNSSNDTATVTVNGPITETANFVRKPVQITIQTYPAGRLFWYDGVTYTTPQTRVVTPGVAHFIDVSPSIQSGVSPDIQYSWNSWSDGGTKGHNIFPDSNGTYTAFFTTQYYLTTIAKPDSGGTVSPVTGWQDSGKIVGVTATANAGYSFTDWKGTGTGSYTGTNNPASVTMNSPIVDTAKFSHFGIQVTITSTPPGRSVIIDGITMTAPQVLTWLSGATHTIASFSPQGDTLTKYLFASWSDGGLLSHAVAPVSDTTFVVHFSTQYYLTMRADTGGTVSPPSGWQDSGKVVRITATPNALYSFGGWNGAGTGAYHGIVKDTTIAMNSPITEIASFALNPVNITIRTNLNGRSFTVDGITYASTQTFIWNYNSLHTIGTTSPQPGTAGTQYLWLNWSDGKTISHTVSPVTDTVFTANFVTQYYLTMAANPDTAGIVNPPSGWQDSGKVVPITITPLSGYSFAAWSGTGSISYSGTNSSSSVTVNSPITETANFGRFSAHVTVRTNPLGLSFTVDDTSYTNSHTFTWTTGSLHTIAVADTSSGGTGTRYIWVNWSDARAQSHTIIPQNDTMFTANFTTQYYLTMNASVGGTVTPTSNWFTSGQAVQIQAFPDSKYDFIQWSGSGNGSVNSSSVNPTTVTMNGPITEAPNFARKPVQITIQSNPPGRSFIYDGATYTIPQTRTVIPGTSHFLDVILTQPDPDTTGVQYAWTSWSDGGQHGHNIFPDSSITYTANFVTQYSLTTNANPPANGTVTPAGQNFYTRGDTATITAIGNTGYTFSGWSGDASGTSNPLRMVINRITSVTANFAPSIQVTISAIPSGRAITVDDSTYTTTKTLAWVKGSSHTIATTTPQPGVVGVQYLWNKWSDSGAILHTVAPTKDTTFTATFATQYYLTMIAGTGGVVTPLSGWHLKDELVSIQALSDTGYAFVHWTGTGIGSYTGGDSTVNVTMGSPITEVAAFGLILPPPTLLSVANNSSNISANPVLSWQRYSGASSYTIRVARDSLFSSVIFDSSGIADTSVQLHVLANSTSYYWHIRAFVGPNVTTFSTAWKFTTLSATLAAVLPDINWATGFSYNIEWTSSNLSGSVNVLLSTNSGTTFSTIKSGISNTGSTSWSVPDTQIFVSDSCKLRIESALNNTITGTSLQFSIVNGRLPATTTLSALIGYSTNPISIDYRLFSGPGVVDTVKLGTFLPGSQGADWRAFTDNGQDANYLVEMSATTRLTTGMGYWLVKKGDLNLPNIVMAMPHLSNDATYGIPLHAGWNIIANPFDKSVPWQAVVNTNALPLSTQLMAYNGSYAQSTTLEPFHGYYFFNSTNLSSLKIPYPFGSPSARPLISHVNWSLRLSFDSDINHDPENYIGIAPSAKMGMDQLDSHKPPLFLDQGFLYFPRPEWDGTYSRFSSDFRPALGEGQVWDFEISNPRKSKGIIRVNGITDIPEGAQVMLINEFNTTPIDLRARQEYIFDMVSSKMPFKILVGSKAFVEKELSKLMPETFELAQNFPNPFNPTTSISIKLPRETHARLEIFNLLGQRVRTLADGRYAQGIYTFVWNGADQSGQPAASGVYFYRLMDGENLIQAKKMIFAK